MVQSRLKLMKTARLPDIQQLKKCRTLRLGRRANDDDRGEVKLRVDGKTTGPSIAARPVRENSDFLGQALPRDHISLDSPFAVLIDFNGEPFPVARTDAPARCF
jgi:hypothetical protein